MIDLEKHIKEQRMLLDSDSPLRDMRNVFVRNFPIQAVEEGEFPACLADSCLHCQYPCLGVYDDTQLPKVEIKWLCTRFPHRLLEADQYYSTQVDHRVDQIRQFDFNNEEEKTVLLNELEELDTYQQQLMKDLEANPDDERVINALINHYQMKLDVMDQIIYQLNQLKTETDKNNEKESV